MQKVQLEPFKVIGISVRTENGHGQAAQDIPKLWEKFMMEGISEKIPNKLDDRVFSIYTNYESDFNGPYDTILACAVSSLDDIPEGMVGQSFSSSGYRKKTVHGDLTDGLIYKAWTEIWNMNLKRNYQADFEVYGEKSRNLKDAEVDIYVSVTD